MNYLLRVIFAASIVSLMMPVAWGNMKEKVDLLPTSTQAQKVKKAVLALALDNADKFRAGGDDETAKRLEKQVTDLLDKDWGRIADVPKNILPAVAEWEGNPYVAGVLEDLKKRMSKPDIEFKMGEAGMQQFMKGKNEHPLDSRKIAEEIRFYAWSALHPQSPHRGNPEVLIRALRRAHAYSDAYVRAELSNKDMTINDFFACYSMMDGLLTLKHGCPELLLPVQKERWDAAVKKAGKFWMEFIDKHKGWWTEEHPRGFGSFCNHNVTEGMIVQFAGLYLDHKEYQDVGKRVVALQKKSFHPDGAIAYIRKQNECFGYHTVNIEKFIRHWELTGDPVAMEILKGTRNYYPLTVEPGNVNEWWTNPVWKYMWNSTGYGHGQEIIAGITGCPYNKAIAAQELKYNNGKINSIIAAPYYKSEIKPAELPTDFVVFDRNIQGPRSRFGHFATAMVGRDYGNDDSGKITFAGCLVTDPVDHRRYPLNAALMAVYPRVRINNQQPDWQGCAYLSRNEKNTMAVGKSFGSLTTTHDLERTSYGQAVFPEEWSASQQWLALPGRIVGMVEVFPKSGKQKAFDITGRIRLGYGRCGSLRPKEIKNLDDKNYEYGDLKIRLHQHNYPGIKTEISGIIRDDARKATEIVLYDPDINKNEAREYSSDTSQFFTVEVMPKWSTPADAVRAIRDENIRGFELQEGLKRFLLIHNTSDKTVTYKADLNGWPKAQLIASFTGNAGKPLKPEEIEMKPNLTLNIPPYSHTGLVSSPDAGDLEPGLYDFGKLLK